MTFPEIARKSGMNTLCIVCNALCIKVNYLLLNSRTGHIIYVGIEIVHNTEKRSLNVLPVLIIIGDFTGIAYVLKYLDNSLIAFTGN